MKLNPFVKWAGGKGQIVDVIIEHIKSFGDINDGNFTFYEPFVGGGAVFLNLQHNNVVINDLNTELMNCYEVIKTKPIELMEYLNLHKERYLDQQSDYYYKIRELDRNKTAYKSMTNLEKAARTIFLNKTCYNGLYRVNLKGEFNTPAGRYKNPSLYSEKNIKALSDYFNEKNIMFMNVDYKAALENVKSGDVIYIDPPYDYGESVGFTQYQKESFNFENFIELKETLDKCLDKNAYVIISNNATKRVIDLFESDERYKKILIDITNLNTRRSINSKANGRKSGKEVIIMGIPETFPQANDIEKILRLLMVNDESNFKDSLEMQSILEVSSYRQVQYYLMALKYLNLIDSNKRFTEIARKIRTMNYDERDVMIAKRILSKNVFKEVYNLEIKQKNSLDKSEVINIMRKNHPELSDNTIERRASTVMKWVEWSKSVLYKSGEFYTP